jgi:hypothetical protein
MVEKQRMDNMNSVLGCRVPFAGAAEVVSLLHS